MNHLCRSLMLLMIGILLGGCANYPELKTVKYVDLDRFMGDWYVIANIPTFIEKRAYNATESYSLSDDGTVATTFTFSKDGFNGTVKSFHPKGFVRENTGNAVWGMQFIWPIKAEYRIIYLDEDYQHTVIGRSARDFVWIMARTPLINNDTYENIVKFIEDVGYDITRLQRVPQQSLEQRLKQYGDHTE